MKTSFIRLFILPLAFLIAMISMGIFEQCSLDSRFNKYVVHTEKIMQQVLAHNSDLTEITKMQNQWKDSTSKLHIYIPHNDIKDIEPIIARIKGSLEVEDFETAYTELSVLYAKFKAIPRQYQPKIENVF